MRGTEVDTNMHPAQRNGRGYAAIGLEDTKSRWNLGSAMRACAVYNAVMLAYTGTRFEGAPTDTPKQYRHMPHECVCVAVDFIDGAVPLQNYTHPDRAFYIFGAEDQTLGEKTTNWCPDKIYVPTNGCMNLAATVNVVLYDRMAKQLLGKDDG